MPIKCSVSLSFFWLNYYSFCYYSSPAGHAVWNPLWLGALPVVLEVQRDYLKVLCERSDSLRLSKRKQRLEAHLQLGWNAGLSSSRPDRLRHMLTHFPSGQTGRPADGRRVGHLVTAIHSSCHDMPEAAEGPLNLHFFCPLLAHSAEISNSRTALF